MRSIETILYMEGNTPGHTKNLIAQDTVEHSE